MAELEGFCAHGQGPWGPWGAALPCRGWWGSLCLVAVRMGSCPVGPLTMGLAQRPHGSDTQAGMVSAGKGSWVPASGTAGLAWVWQQLCAGVEPTEQTETFGEGSLAEQGAKGGPGAVQGLTLWHAPLCISPAPI